MSIRRLFTSVTVALLLLAVASAFSLGLVSTVLSGRTKQVERALRSVHAADRLQSNLLLHNRAGFRYALTGEDSYLRTRNHAERNISNLLGTLLPDAAPDEVALFEDTSKRLKAYFEASKRADATLAEQLATRIQSYMDAERALELRDQDAIRVYRVLDPLMDEAFEASERLVQYEIQKAGALASKATRLSNQLDLLAPALSVLLLGGIPFLVILVRRRVYAPFENVLRAVGRYGGGDHAQRAPETGPREIRQIARCFNEMARRLAEHRDAQLEFLASVAHELRNPLSALRLAAAGAARWPAGSAETESRLRGRMGLVARQAERLERLVKDLLEVFQSEAGRISLQLSEHDLRTIVEDTVALYESNSEQHPVLHCAPDEPVRVRCDAVRLEQVLSNLLSNAIKYSPAGGSIDVRLEVQQSEAVISVRDQGIGLEPAQQEALFQPFSRLHPEHRQIPGIGLGLSVARTLVEAQGGRLEVRSAPNQGSTFRIHLPLGGEPTRA